MKARAIKCFFVIPLWRPAGNLRRVSSFIEDSGYSRPELWLSDGWKAVQSNRWKAPLYWEKSGSQWIQFTCSGMRKVEEAEPVCM